MNCVFVVTTMQRDGTPASRAYQARLDLPGKITANDVRRAEERRGVAIYSTSAQLWLNYAPMQ
jgi:hypothetical protein